MEKLKEKEQTLDILEKATNLMLMKKIKLRNREWS